MDGGKQSPRFFVVPISMLRNLHLEINRVNGPVIEKELLFRIGYLSGRATARSMELTPDSDIASVLYLQWAEMGLGMLSVAEKYPRGMLIENRRSSEAIAMGQTGKPSCDFTRGYLAGALSVYQKKEYNVIEKQCISEGYSHCIYVLTLRKDGQ